MKTIEDLVLACSKLRAAVGAAEVQLYEFLRDAESGYRHLWAAKYPSFARFLEGEQICSAGRYNAYAQAVDAVGIDVVMRFGVDATQILPKVPANKRAQVVKALEEWAKQHQGRMPKMEVARRIAQQIHPVAKEPHVIARMNELEQLREENKTLKRRVTELEKRLAKLQKKDAHPN